MDNKKIVKPGPGSSLIDENGLHLTPPHDWDFLPAGDAGITRKVTANGLFWRVQIKKGRRLISNGIWAPSHVIEQARKEVAKRRDTDEYKRKLERERQRREEKQAAYIKEFCKQVRRFLAFAPRYADLEEQMAEAVTELATPVGSGTVARTSMIPIEERADKAVIAWMRHRTTNYESMKIPRIKGKRREVRKMLAQRSLRILKMYRRGDEIPIVLSSKSSARGTVTKATCKNSPFIRPLRYDQVYIARISNICLGEYLSHALKAGIYMTLIYRT